MFRSAWNFNVESWSSSEVAESRERVEQEIWRLVSQTVNSTADPVIVRRLFNDCWKQSWSNMKRVRARTNKDHLTQSQRRFL
ncbi:hypothetical protein RUND412_001673 [Rhizina undulata]